MRFVLGVSGNAGEGGGAWWLRFGADQSRITGCRFQVDFLCNFCTIPQSPLSLPAIRIFKTPPQGLKHAVQPTRSLHSIELKPFVENVETHKTSVLYQTGERNGTTSLVLVLPQAALFGSQAATCTTHCRCEWLVAQPTWQETLS